MSPVLEVSTRPRFLLDCQSNVCLRFKHFIILSSRDVINLRKFKSAIKWKRLNFYIPCTLEAPPGGFQHHFEVNYFMIMLFILSIENKYNITEKGCVYGKLKYGGPCDIEYPRSNTNSKGRRVKEPPYKKRDRPIAQWELIYKRKTNKLNKLKYKQTSSVYK